MDHIVKYMVEVENFTDEGLHLVKCQIHKGQIQKPPKDIRPGFKEAFSGCKTSYAPTGAIGSVAYRIGSTDKVLAINVMCPFFFPLSSNALALGVYRWTDDFVKSMPDNYMYKYMYRADNPWRKRFYTDADPLEVTDEEGEYLVRGFMGTTHSAEITLSLYPTDENRLAPSMKQGFVAEIVKRVSRCKTS